MGFWGRGFLGFDPLTKGDGYIYKAAIRCIYYYMQRIAKIADERNRSKNWFFTINNPTESLSEVLDKLKNLGPITYAAL